MFLHQSNRLETLFQQLHALLRTPLADPLAPEIIVVHNQGMAQWVARQIALASGIAAHLHFPLPARFVWDLYHRLSGAAPEEDLFRKPVLLWRIQALLPQLLNHPAFREIAAYLRDDVDGSKCSQLAGRISDVFDQYPVYRPDLLDRWEKHSPDDHWQSVLWRHLTASAVPHRARLPERFRRLLADPDRHTARLPQRFHLFGINSLAPVYLEIMNGISRLTEVHLFHLSPCRHYWGDLVSARQLAGLRRKRPATAATGADLYLDQGHPLLVSLGRTGQEFFRQLLEECELQDFDLHAPREQPHLLAALQNDILDLNDRSAAGQERYSLEPGDRSLQFHLCFSPLREIQVLHDRLLDLFQEYPDLTPGDILVSGPDMRIYADAIAGVFEAAGQERRIPWSMADQPMDREEPLIRCFLDLLNLFTGRFTAPEVLALCETEPLLQRFSLDPAFLPRLHAWVRDTGIRWGLDAAHRQELEVNSGLQYSWRFGLDRLLLGHLMGECHEPYQELLPYPHLTGAETVELGGFLTLIETLARWRLTLRQQYPVAEWCRLLLELLQDFFDPGQEDQGLRTLRETINALDTDCRLARHTGPIAPPVIKHHMETVLSRPGDGQTFLSGRVTFCNMVPMRSVPFRVIWLLGMNDQDFPRGQQPVAFDLMAQEPRLGDRNRRNDDRYLFLEALLSARDLFAISWAGRNQRDDNVAPPSVVVSELRDYLDQSCSLAGETGPAASSRLTTAHPMQPFSRRCFDGTPATASYNPAWQPAECGRERSPFLDAPLAEPGPEGRSVDLLRFARFWSHPVRFFLRQIVGLSLQGGEAGLEESEPFALDHLRQYQLRQETVCDLLQGLSPEQVRRNLTAGGCLPQGGFGRTQFAGIAGTGAPFADRLRPLLAAPLAPLEIDRIIGGFRLTGWLTDLSPHGRVTWRTSALKGSTLIELWIFHLVLNLLAPPDLPPHTLHLARDPSAATPALLATLRPVADPERHLRELLELYWQGLSQPLPFFPATSLAWAQASGTGKEAEKAHLAWVGNFQRQGEGADPAYAYFFPADELPASDRFIALSGLFNPILAHLEESRAAA